MMKRSIHLYMLKTCLRRKNFIATWNRRYSSKTNTEHKVFVSLSDDIYMNLALEDWFYEKVDFSKETILLMWKNKPAIVIGRHQNPFLECDVWKIGQSDVNLARRKSGGGTVYHDQGNLNCSFMKHRSEYDRVKNLSLAVDALTNKWDVDLKINTRDDVLLNGFYKVSGTASKLGRNSTYHHFTLLLDVNKDNMFKYLNSPFTEVGVNSKATQSQRSVVKNLKENIPDINFNTVVNLIGNSFLNGHGCQKTSIQWILPTEKQFPGLNQIYKELTGWQWLYGRTPNFSLNREFSKIFGKFEYCAKIKVDVEKGTIAKLSIDTNYKEALSNIEPSIKRHFTGRRFIYDELLNSLINIKKDVKNIEDTEIIEWTLQCISKTLCLF